MNVNRFTSPSIIVVLVRHCWRASA